MTTPFPHLPMGEGAEFDAIRLLLDVWGDKAHGIGDDAAVLTHLREADAVLSTDTCVEHVHFERAWLSPKQVGARATAAALSDLAAMGAVPVALLVSFIVPRSWRALLGDVARGIGEQLAGSDAKIVGGNLSAGTEFSITTTAVGRTTRAVLRRGARPGDCIAVTGALGGPRVALTAHARGVVPDSWAASRLVSPVPRLREGQWLAARGATAMIDISDGLRADAMHLARASNVDLVIAVDKVPCGPWVQPADALASGEEFELLATLPGNGADDIVTEFTNTFHLPLAIIGRVESAGQDGARVREEWPSGTRPRVEIDTGHDHFSQR